METTRQPGDIFSGRVGELPTQERCGLASSSKKSRKTRRHGVVVGEKKHLGLGVSFRVSSVDPWALKEPPVSFLKKMEGSVVDD